jgi:mRNA interferase RelE/StbE
VNRTDKGLYEIVFPRRVRKSMTRRLPESAYQRVLQVIRDLENDPRPRGAVKMRGTEEQEEWRVRVGDYRIVYREDDEAREVIILAVGHCGSVYG